MIEKLRSQKITIDLPSEEGEVWVHAIIQKVFKDEETYESGQVIDRVDHVYRAATKFIMQMETIVDPVTQQEVTISGAALGMLVKQFVIRWITEDLGGTVNEYGDVVL